MKAKKLQFTKAQKALLQTIISETDPADPFRWWEMTIEDNPRTVKALMAKGVFVQSSPEEVCFTPEGYEAAKALGPAPAAKPESHPNLTFLYTAGLS